MKREGVVDSSGVIGGSIKSKSKYKLLVLDFDYTMTDCHTHNIAMTTGNQKTATVGKGLVVDGIAYEDTEIYKGYDPEALEVWSKKFFGKVDRFVSRVEQVEFIRDSLKDGVKVVVASHSKYPKLIEVGLVNLGLTPDEAAQIHVICGEPLDSANGKNEHIDVAKELHGIKGDCDVLLVDDSIPNRSAAIEKGVNVVSVRPFVPYLYDAKLKMGYIEEDDAFTDCSSSEEGILGDGYDEEGESETSEETIPEFIKFNRTSRGELEEDVDSMGDVESEGSEY